MTRASNTNRSNAFTLIETMVATAVVGIFFVALYAGIAQGFGIIGNAREDLRANQILLDKMEEMRLYSWDQINSYGASNSFIPTAFTEDYYPAGTNLLSTVTRGDTPSATGNFRYYGSILITNVAFTNTAYITNMRQVIVNVRWTNGSKRFDHQMTTYVSQYGLQKYIY
jgi:prepilin-type N-terminal cleavage/methylation domain-containing protein